MSSKHESEEDTEIRFLILCQNFLIDANGMSSDPEERDSKMSVFGAARLRPSKVSFFKAWKFNGYDFKLSCDGKPKDEDSLHASHELLVLKKNSLWRMTLQHPTYQKNPCCVDWIHGTELISTVTVSRGNLGKCRTPTTVMLSARWFSLTQILYL